MQSINIDCMKFLIVDDHALVREGTERVLRTLDPEAQVFTASSGSGGLQVLRDHQKMDCVILDLDLEDMNGLEFLSASSDLLLDIPVLVVSSACTMSDIKNAMKAGAQGYCTKATGLPALRAAIMLVLAGEVFVPSVPASNGHPGSDASYSLSAPLRPYQRDILMHMCNGHSNLRISGLLNISETKVEEHIRGIFETLMMSVQVEQERQHLWKSTTTQSSNAA